MTEDLSSGKKVYLRPNTEGEKYIKTFVDPAKNFKPKSEKEHEFYNQVLNSICAQCGKGPTTIPDFPVNVAIWSQFASDYFQQAGDE